VLSTPPLCYRPRLCAIDPAFVLSTTPPLCYRPRLCVIDPAFVLSTPPLCYRPRLCVILLGLLGLYPAFVLRRLPRSPGQALPILVTIFGLSGSFWLGECMHVCLRSSSATILLAPRPPRSRSTPSTPLCPLPLSLSRPLSPSPSRFLCLSLFWL
jgi:hypothetical protein